MKGIVFAAVACLSAAPALADANRCTQQTTRGAWGFTCEGYLAFPPGTALQPARSLGTCTASRSAVWNCEASVNIGGHALIAQQLQGQADNNEDCTGTIVYAQTLTGIGRVGDLHIRYLILDDGDKIIGLPTDGDQVLSCVLHRMSP